MGLNKQKTNDLQIDNWKYVRQHYIDWWDNKGLVLHIDVTNNYLYENSTRMPQTEYFRRYHSDPDFCCRENISRLKKTIIVGDTLPMAMPDFGTVVLAAYLGAEPGFGEATVWYNPIINRYEDHQTLEFNEENKWWKIHKLIFDQMNHINNGSFLIGCPALTPGLDCLAALRGTEELLMDMIDRPDLVKSKLQEIDRAYFDIYQKIFDMILMADGSSAFGYFSLWGPGKTSQLQCDVSAMLSPDMFAEFVVPHLREYCKWLDNSLYHLDGTQCLCHLDQLLSIKELRAIEWTPQSGIEKGGNKRWHKLYAEVLEAGKSIQIVDVMPEEVIPLIEAIGNKGVYIMTHAEDRAQALRLADEVDRKR